MKALAKRILKRLGWHLVRRNPYTSPLLDGEVYTLFDYRLVRTFQGNLEGLCFVQVGANDGQRIDPIQRYIMRYHWRGVMIEPVRESFDALQRRYAHSPGIQLVRAAVDTQEGLRKMYVISDTNRELPDFTRAISSFLREHVLSFASIAPGLEKHIVEEEVPCHTLSRILTEAGLDRVDLLQIDTEGWDDKILMQVDLEILRPALIQFESSHLDSERLAACMVHLRKHDYGFGMEEGDICAYDERIRIASP